MRPRNADRGLNLRKVASQPMCEFNGLLRETVTPLGASDEVRASSVAKSVMALVLAALIQTTSATQSGQTIIPIRDDAAYAVYAAALGSGPWNGVWVIQQETQSLPYGCERRQFLADPEWAIVLQNFRTENTQPRLLTPMLTIPNGSYRFISRAAVEADRRLELEYARRRQSRPDAITYTAFSAIGFNQTKTKALVYIEHRSTAFGVGNGSGAWRAMELDEGKWEPLAALGRNWIS